MGQNDDTNTKSVSIGNVIIIKINDRNIKVKKLGLISYSSLSRGIKDLIASGFDLMTIFGGSGDQTLAFLNMDDKTPVEQRSAKLSQTIVNMIDTNVMQVIKFIDTCVPDLGFEYICDEVGLSDLVIIIEAIVEVNKLIQVVDDAKNLITGLLEKPTKSKK